MSVSIKAMWSLRCPQCRKGKMFQHSGLNIGKFIKMNKSCPKCGCNFEPEPGFYFGAMYFSYGINMAIMISCAVATYVLINPESTVVWILSAMIPCLMLVPFTFRFSRALMLHLFGGASYKPGAIEKHQSEQNSLK
ncbi:DUF983 domain-containing protein [Rapidithrix thailandica]|uniref:DUF983 domain-containing protein n=1 Tax=Rapidithrix thailandica TaxID=413964 RepID=A0AAW9S7D8_9BACT